MVIDECKLELKVSIGGLEDVQKIIDNIRTQYELINHLKDGLEDQIEVIGEMLENLEVVVVNNQSLEKEND